MADGPSTSDTAETIEHRAPPPGAEPLPAIPDVELTGEIGRGGMGRVYKGRQTFLGRDVAVKVLLRGNTDPRFVQRFRREAKILAGMTHEHIVACYSAGLTPTNDCYMVMEFIDGPDLARWIEERGALNALHALDICRAIALALDYAQDSDIIHRDVKPENILLSSRRRRIDETHFPFVPKLADLGLARPVSETTSGNITEPGQVMGTPATMAPEQFEDPDGVDFRADVYGLGCALFHALTGRRAFPQRTITEVAAAKARPDVPDPRSIAPLLPEDVARFTMRLIARDPDDRPESYEEVISVLDRLIGAARPSSSATIAATLAAQRVPSKPPQRSRWVVPTGVAVLIASGLGFGAWLMGAYDQSTDPGPSRPGPVGPTGSTGSTGSTGGEVAPTPPDPIDPPVVEPEPPEPIALFRSGRRERLDLWNDSSAGSQWVAEEGGPGVVGTGWGSKTYDLGVDRWRLSGRIALLPTDAGEKTEEAGMRIRLENTASYSLKIQDLDAGTAYVGLYANVLDPDTMQPRDEVERADSFSEGLRPERPLAFELAYADRKLALRLGGVQFDPVELESAPKTLYLFVTNGRVLFRDLVLTPLP